MYKYIYIYTSNEGFCSIILGVKEWAMGIPKWTCVDIQLSDLAGNNLQAKLLMLHVLSYEEQKNTCIATLGFIG